MNTETRGGSYIQRCNVAINMGLCRW